MLNVKISKKDFHKYPLLSPLLEIHDTPKSLNFKVKDENILQDFLNKKFNGGDYKILTIVGSRRYSNYGKDIVEYILKGLRGQKIIIVSGLALGIDALAHAGAIKNELKTISFPGSGLGENIIYPATNRNLANQILETENLLISEYEEKSKSQIYYFPERNRLMAAISDAVLIIEASEKSGTLITARLAMEYNKNVGVIPNNILSEGSIGSNKLIRDGAMPILHFTDVLELLQIQQTTESVLSSQDNLKNILESLTEIEKVIFKKILKEGNLDKEILLNKLAKENKIKHTEAIVALMSLEINGLIKEELGEIRIIK